jgi:hypothetical protein
VIFHSYVSLPEGAIYGNVVGYRNNIKRSAEDGLNVCMFALEQIWFNSMAKSAVGFAFFKKFGFNYIMSNGNRMCLKWSVCLSLWLC